VKHNVAIFNDTSVLPHHGCNLVMANRSLKLASNNINPCFFWPVGVDWRPHVNDILNEISDVRAVIVNGEGTVHDSNRRQRARTLAQISEFSIDRLGVPAYLINATFYNLEANTLEHLSKFRRIFVRETMSQKYLAQFGIDAWVMPDLSMAFPIGPYEGLRRGSIVNDSVESFKNEALFRYSKKNRLPFILLDKRRSLSFRMSSKLRDLSGFSRKTTQFQKSLRASVDYGSFVEKLQQYSFVITGRFHMVTLCILTKTPFVSVESNTPKIAALLEDVFGSTSRLTDFDFLDRQGQSRVFEQFGAFDDKELISIEKYLSVGREQIDNAFDMIQSDLQGA